MRPARRLRFGMVGGGPGSFIGETHRRAAEADGLAHLVAGAFSSDPAKSREQGARYLLHPSRVYDSYEAMAEAEARRPADERLDFIIIVTPNHLHWPVARAFIERGFHIVCDKPLTTTLSDAEALCALVRKHDVIFALTHAYAAYPMVKQARYLVQSGELGQVRKVMVEYAQGWLAAPLEQSEGAPPQALWRTDPARAGAGALGDIGTHAEHLARYITGLPIARLLADVATVVSGRRIDDDANILLHFSGGARGVLCASQVATGEENALSIRVYGTKAALTWRQEEPNTLLLRHHDSPTVTALRAGAPTLCPAARHATRFPPGHPEGLSDAFANLYKNVIHTIAARAAGAAPSPLDTDFPTAEDGAIGVHFVQAALQSSAQGGVWVDAKYTPKQ